MKKILSIVLKSLLALLGLILILVILLPVIFKPQLMERVKREINNNVEATVNFEDFRLNLIRHFPRMYIGLTGLSVTGLGEFENDTLAAFRSISVSVNLLSILGDEGIEIKSILLDEPRIRAMVLEDGTANWDIMKETGEEEIPDTTAGEIPAFHIRLKKFEIRNASVAYDDRQSDLFASLDGFNFILSGDMTRDYTDLNIWSGTNALNLVMGGIRFLRDATLGLDIMLGADLKNLEFTFRENEIRLNDFAFGFNGTVKMPADDIETDITFQAKETSFKTILSLIPAIYMSDFQELKTEGQLALSGFVKGTYSETDSTLPDLSLELRVTDAMFKYPDLPKSVDGVNILAALFMNGKDMDRSTVDINRFQLRIAGNPVDAELHLRTPVSDPEVEGRIKGSFDLASFMDIIPLEEISLKGLVNANLSLGGKMSMYEKEQYEEFRADGMLALTGFEFKSPDVPKDVLIREAVLNFSPRFVDLSSFYLQIGRSDIGLKGKLENFIPYVFSDGTLYGSLDFTSSLLDLNELMPEDQEETLEEDTAALSAIEVPANINFSLSAALDKVAYDKMDITGLKGTIWVRDGKVVLEGLKMGLLEGLLVLSGEYNTQDMTKPAILANLDILKIGIPATFNTFNTVQSLAPVAKNLNGNMSVILRFNSLLGPDMLPVISTISGYGKVQSESVQVVSSKTFDMISSALSLGSDRTNVLKNLNISFNIREGRVFVDPFEARLGDIRLVIGGDQGIDQTMNYLVKMTIPRAAFGSSANQVIDNLAAQARERGLNIQPGENIHVDVTVTGTFLDPKISLGMKEAAGNALNQVRQQLEDRVRTEVEQKKEEVMERIDEEKEELRARADEEAQRILREAEEKAAELKAAAQRAGDVLIREADASAKKLEDEAKGKGRLAELTAQRAAEKLRNEAKEKADRLLREADEKSKVILDEAREKAGLLQKKE